MVNYTIVSGKNSKKYVGTVVGIEGKYSNLFVDRIIYSNGEDIFHSWHKDEYIWVKTSELR